MTVFELFKQCCLIPLGALVVASVVALLVFAVVLYAKGFRFHLWHNGDEDDKPDQS